MLHIPFSGVFVEAYTGGVKLEDGGHHYYPIHIERSLIILTFSPPYRIISIQQSLKYIVKNIHTTQASQPW